MGGGFEFGVLGVGKGGEVLREFCELARIEIYFRGLAGIRLRQGFCGGNTRFASAVAQKLWRDRRRAARESEGLRPVRFT